MATMNINAFRIIIYWPLYSMIGKDSTQIPSILDYIKNRTMVMYTATKSPSASFRNEKFLYLIQFWTDLQF